MPALSRLAKKKKMQMVARQSTAKRMARLRLEAERRIKNEDMASTPSPSISQSGIDEDHFISRGDTDCEEDGVKEEECKVEVKEEEEAEEDEDDLIEPVLLEEQPIPSRESGGRKSSRRRKATFSGLSRDPLAMSPPPPEVDQDVNDAENRKVSTCLLCADKLTNKSTGRSSYRVSSPKDKDFLVMFVMKKMLGLPNQKLEKYLRLFGHPRDWISFCPRCMPKIMTAFGIQKEINELEDKLKKFQADIKDLISLNYVKNEKKVISAIAAAMSEEKQREDPLRVTRETWCFVGYDKLPKKPKPKPSAPIPIPQQVVLVPSYPTIPTYVIVQPNYVPTPTPPTTQVPEVPTPRSSVPSPQTSNPTPRAPRRRKQEMTVSSLRSHPDSIPTVGDEETPSFLSDTAGDAPSEDSGDNLLEVVKCAVVSLQDQLEGSPEMRLKNKKDTNAYNFDTRWCTKLRFKDADSVFHSTGYTCPICPDLKGMKVDAFVKHIIYHKWRPYKCSVCGIFLTGSELELGKLPKLKHDGVPENHVCIKETIVPVTFHPGNIWECSRCEETFSLEEERRAHEKEVHNLKESRIELPYECSWCSGSKFRDYVEWRLHRALEHPELAKVACFHCDELFVIKTKEDVDIEDGCGRKKHIKDRHGPNARPPFSALCFICGQILNVEGELQDHVERAHGLEWNQCRSCPICFSRYPKALSLRIHVKGVHSVAATPKEKFICDVCGYETVSGGSFHEHKFMKHGMEPEDGRPIYSCTEAECSFKCTLKMTLRIHKMKEHNAPRPFKCETCGKGFLNNGNLREHRQIHLNATNKPYQCEICGNSFAVKNYLYIHMRLSHQNRPFASTHKKKPSRSSKKKNLEKSMATVAVDVNPSTSDSVEAASSKDDLS